MPVVRTIRNHKYQILSENELELIIIDKANGEKYLFTKIEDRTEDELEEMFPGIPVLKYKKMGYYFLNLRIRTRDMSSDVAKNKEFSKIESILNALQSKNKKDLSVKEKKSLKEAGSQIKKIPKFIGRISHTNLMEPVFEGPLNSGDLYEAMTELNIIRDGLPKEYQANLFGRKRRKPKVITDGKNIKV